MIYLNTQDISPLLDSVLIIDSKRVILQHIDKKCTTLIEYDIPFMTYKFSKKQKEFFIKIDEFIIDCFKNYKCMCVKENILYFDSTVSYEYEEGELLEWNTEKIKLYCCFIVPEKILHIIERDIQIEISISDDKKFLKLDDCCGKVLKINIYNIIEKFDIPPQRFSSTLIIDNLYNHKGEFCKMYIGNELPLQFEFTKERIFIAPLE